MYEQNFSAFKVYYIEFSLMMTLKTKNIRQQHILRKFLFPAIFILLIQLMIAPPALALSDIWVSAYYAGWMQGCGYKGHLSAEQIDYSAVTHILHFSLFPGPEGSVDEGMNCIYPENSSALVHTAHAAKKKVLISVGGWDTEAGFLEATNDGNRQRFITNLVNFLTERGYDGIDIDWEPLSSSSAAQYAAFITELRAALDSITPRPLLTAAVLWEPMIIASVQDKLDQINIMTYELSGPWPKWTSWHNAPLYDAGYWFESTGKSVPSADNLVQGFFSAGIQQKKLGIGIEFYGAVWRGGKGTPTGGVTAPGQKWKKAPPVEIIPYYEIMDRYFQPCYYRWDFFARSPYLSIDNPRSSNDIFISFDDEFSCSEKISYIREKGIGGAIIFELGGGWRPAALIPDTLLQAVKNATSVHPGH